MSVAPGFNGDVSCRSRGLVVAAPAVGTADAMTAPSRVQELVLPELKHAVDRLRPSMRTFVGYHLGWWDQDGTPIEAGSGKMIRAALVVLTAHEIVAVDLGDVSPDGDAVRVRGGVYAHRHREVPVSGGEAHAAAAAWRRERAGIAAANPAFFLTRRGVRISLRHNVALAFTAA